MKGTYLTDLPKLSPVRPAISPFEARRALAGIIKTLRQPKFTKFQCFKF